MCGWHSGIFAVGIRGVGNSLRHVRAGQVLQRAGVGDLVHAAAHEQVARERAGGRVVAHLVDAQLAAAGAGLEEVVVREVLDEVAGGVHVGAVPRLAVGVGRQRALAAEEVVLLVGLALGVVEVDAGEHRVDRRGHELDVAVLLGGDVRDQVVEGPRALPVAEVERLERVVHQRRHLAELAAHQLLHGGGARGIRRGRARQLRLEAIDSQNHASALPIAESVGRLRHAGDRCGASRCARASVAASSVAGSSSP